MLRNKKEIMMNGLKLKSKGGGCSQVVKAVDCEFITRGFEPRRSPTLKERGTFFPFL